MTGWNLLVDWQMTSVVVRGDVLACSPTVTNLSWALTGAALMIGSRRSGDTFSTWLLQGQFAVVAVDLSQLGRVGRTGGGKGRRRSPP